MREKEIVEQFESQFFWSDYVNHWDGWRQFRAYDLNHGLEYEYWYYTGYEIEGGGLTETHSLRDLGYHLPDPEPYFPEEPEEDDLDDVQAIVRRRLDENAAKRKRG